VQALYTLAAALSGRIGLAKALQHVQAVNHQEVFEQLRVYVHLQAEHRDEVVANWRRPQEDSLPGRTK